MKVILGVAIGVGTFYLISISYCNNVNNSTNAACEAVAGSPTKQLSIVSNIGLYGLIGSAVLGGIIGASS